MKAGFRPWAVGVFEMLFSPLRSLWIHGPVWAGPIPAIETGMPLLLVANHSSWWDGFVLRDVQKKLRPGAPLYTMMTERELRRHPFLRWLGCVGVEPGNGASALAAFRSLRDLRRQDDRAVFAFFPQGRIWPASRRPLGFGRGVSVLASMLAPVTVVPVAIQLEPLNRVASTVFVSLGTPVHCPDGRPDPIVFEGLVEAELNGIRRLLERHGEDATDPARNRHATG